ncbi:hypothetical protein COCOBI_01-1720 [Coccomyxa sp. Obi]|nr:hypothetical protein COCOBI_01-1720 [Coccomyxa sp. Obi]
MRFQPNTLGALKRHTGTLAITLQVLLIGAGLLGSSPAAHYTPPGVILGKQLKVAFQACTIEEAIAFNEA